MKKLFVIILALILCLLPVFSFAQIWEGDGGEFIQEGLGFGSGSGGGGGGSIDPLITYQVTFTGYDPSIWSGSIIQDIPKGLNYSIITPQPSAVGYRFLGWTTNADYPNLITLPETVTADAYYLAVFKKISYPLYYSYNGNIVHTDNYCYGDTVVPYIHNISSGNYVQWTNDPVTMPPATTTVTGIAVSTFVHAFEIDQSDGFAVGYLYDSVGMNPISVSGYSDSSVIANWDSSNTSWKTFIESICKPVMLNQNGTVAYELDLDNQMLKKDGTYSDLYSQASGTAVTTNAMVQFKRLYKSTFYNSSNNKITVAFSEYKLNHDFNANPFVSEGGDICNYLYLGMFEGYKVSNILRSINADAKPPTSAKYSGVDLINAAGLNGNGWTIESYSAHDYVSSLLMLFCKNINLNTAYGTGHNWTPPNGINNASLSNIGITKNLGAFVRNENGSNPIKVLWLENFWGNFQKYYLGLKIENSNLYYKPYAPYDYGSSDITNYYEMPKEGTDYTVARTPYGILFPATTGNNKSLFGIYTYNWVLTSSYANKRPTDGGWATSGFFPSSFVPANSGNQISNARLCYLK